MTNHRDKIMSDVINKMCVFLPNTNSGKAQCLINLIKTNKGVDVSYGLYTQINGKFTYFDDAYFQKLETISQALNHDETDTISDSLCQLVDYDIDQVIFTLDTVEDKINARISYYIETFSIERNDPEAELLYWRTLIDYQPKNENEVSKIAKLTAILEKHQKRDTL